MVVMAWPPSSPPSPPPPSPPLPSPPPPSVSPSGRGSGAKLTNLRRKSLEAIKKVVGRRPSVTATAVAPQQPRPLQELEC